ncbi:hypothetical protein ACQ4PT_011087 [Festuca glaucescens]
MGCPDLLKRKELQIFGFGVPGLGFYALEVEELAKTDNSKGVGAIIKVVQGEHSLAIVEKEMKYWVDDKWPWNLNKISNDEYFTNFPSAAALRICMRGGETTSPLCKLQLKVRESDLAPGASAMLQTTWVKVFDVPAHARNELDLKEISKTFGRPRNVDMKTIPGLGPIRVQVDCREAAKLRGRIEIFLNKAGFKFKIEAEGDVPSTVDGSVGKESDKKGSVSVDDESDDEKLSPVHATSESSASSDASFSPSRSSGSPVIKPGMVNNDPKFNELEPMSWNSAGAKAMVLNSMTQEEITGGMSINCTPEDEVFDSEFGKYELDGLGGVILTNSMGKINGLCQKETMAKGVRQFQCVQQGRVLG